ncbi:hypothetical protein BHE74_00018553, partial [Ensete ventricosum]
TPSNHHIAATAINLKITIDLSNPLAVTIAVNLKIAATISNQSIRQIGDPYVMALVDLIGAKLEAFETREPAMASDAVLPDLGYFHYLSQERTTLLEVFLINDLYAAGQRCRKMVTLAVRFDRQKQCEMLRPDRLCGQPSSPPQERWKRRLGDREPQLRHWRGRIGADLVGSVGRGKAQRWQRSLPEEVDDCAVAAEGRDGRRGENCRLAAL